MEVICWEHTTYVSDDGTDWRPGPVVKHEFTDAEAVLLLELMSHGDWENGPRCLRDLLDRYPYDDEERTPVLWVKT